MMRTSGFTMVEMVVGLAVAGAALLLAAAVFGEGVASSRRILRAQEERARRGIAVLWLGAAFASLQVGQGKDDSFSGMPDEVEFTARLETPGGWFEPRRIRLRLSGETVVARVGTRDSVVLFPDVEDMEVHYLMTTGERSEWLRGWRSPATAPLAVRLVIRLLQRSRSVSRADTLLFRIGARG